MPPAPPATRRLQVYAVDPSAELSVATAGVGRCVLPVRWEATPLLPGPVGEYVEVIDVDPSAGCAYAPVDLEHPHVTARDGLAPSDGNPQFHQQMVYAVVMKTVENFERALGRPVLWAARTRDEAGRYIRDRAARYVRRLRVYPHALREPNAYYSPAKRALLFGYFTAPTTDPRDELPGGMVFTCLSHDIIAHETTHAVLDGIHPRLLEPSNPDMLAFHEGFADIVAIFQHFTLPGLVLDQIQRTRGDLSLNSLLATLAVQFGRATKRGGALRNALGTFDEHGRREAPDPARLAAATRPHDRGAVLVAAVFDAFLRIYEERVKDLRRIATDGTGVLKPGDIHPDLARRFAAEAVKIAQRVLEICVRALDYLPPVDVTYGDYLRALITADAEFAPDDPHRYRVAFVEAFRLHGVYPDDVRALGEDSLRWRPVTPEQLDTLRRFMPPVEVLRTMVAAYEFARPEAFEDIPDPFEGEEGGTSGAAEYAGGQKTAAALWRRFQEGFWRPKVRARRADPPDHRLNLYLTEQLFAKLLYYGWAIEARNPGAEGDRDALQRLLGLDMAANQQYLQRGATGATTGAVETHAVRPVLRVRPDGRRKLDLLVVLTQKVWVPLLDEAGNPVPGRGGVPLEFLFRGGCTLHVADGGEVQYAIAKNIGSARRRERNAAFFRAQLAARGLAAVDHLRLRHAGETGDTLDREREPLAVLHRRVGRGDD